jgi:hypothetical protein
LTCRLVRGNSSSSRRYDHRVLEVQLTTEPQEHRLSPTASLSGRCYLLVQLGPVAAGITQRCRTASVARNSTQIISNVITEVRSRLKQKRRFDRAELSRLKSSSMRARNHTKRISDDRVRLQLEMKLDRLKSALQRVTPKGGASVVAIDEAERLISRIVTSREQVQKLVEALRRLCR